ncbi:hypothetical protein GCM10027271_58690 [Saccharopolyspora gloriosae]
MATRETPPEISREINSPPLTNEHSRNPGELRTLSPERTFLRGAEFNSSRNCKGAGLTLGGVVTERSPVGQGIGTRQASPEVKPWAVMPRAWLNRVRWFSSAIM